MEKEILELFNVMVVDKDNLSSVIDTSMLDHGLVLDFVPTENQKKTLRAYNKPLPITTLFTRDERLNGDPLDLIHKQIMHYYEVYGLGIPGLFDLEVTTGTIMTFRFVSGVAVNKLRDMVRDLLYANAPIKDTVALKGIIEYHNIVFELDQIKNNEMKMLLINPLRDKFDNGDDVVRYLCYRASGGESALLIKSNEVIDAVKGTLYEKEIFENNEEVLAKVFNRHKKLLLACKRHGRVAINAVINRISRRSKTEHVPIKEAINKTFITKAINNEVDMSVLDKISVRDKFKYLNLLSYKEEQHETDAFIVRNGKVHIKDERPIYSLKDISRVTGAVLGSLAKDLAHLKDRKILLDKNVEYGLPISRNQAVGNLPFGSSVEVIDADSISSGIYWENDWGSNDLDLSTVDISGERVGWGGRSGYYDNDIVFSGDVTSAPKGAMEFMTSSNKEYGLFVNIYSGDVGTETEIVVGVADKKKWITNTVIREKTTLNSQGVLIGFVRGKRFTVFQTRMNGNRVSKSGVNPMVTRGMSKFWTINNLFDQLNIKYDVDKQIDMVYDNDLTYQGFSYDKLEQLVLTN